MQQGSILPFLEKKKPSRPQNSRQGQPYHSRPNSTSNSDSAGRHRGPNHRRNMHLKLIANETKQELPGILAQISALNATEASAHNFMELDALDENDCPGFVLPYGDEDAGKKGTRIRVFDMDTFDAALLLDPNYKVYTHLGLPKPLAPENDFRSEPNNHFAVSSLTSPLLDHVNSSDPHELESGREGLITPEDVQDDAQLTTATRQRTPKPVAVLNLASERSPGGGWHNGALAQEECLCYRSSLYLSLHRRYYPLPSLSAIYSPSVVLIRDAMSRGHGLLTPYELPENLPVTSVISVAALRRPPLTDDRKFYRNAGLRAETKRKIRVTIRVAALKGHTKIVLGAMGCGVFANPPKEVAECFLEVLRENEFQGGWWEEVAFAVLDNVKGPQGGKDGEGNFGVFYRVLDGQVV
ncbi:hypothetical protein BKA66DRAFT_405246 [Pyrenochaeta sp. MPI-SDFR-AT-0127]|nr:hypothetical protein BKA66DRAFT_405246 [Pyrenochaeta sp. MPI-SDFR-AT-0127]